MAGTFNLQIITIRLTPSISHTEQGVLGTVIVNDEGEPIRATTICEADGTPVADQNAAGPYTTPLFSST